MSLIITDNHYFACINYYLILTQAENIKIEQCERWEKASFRNRCVVATATGMVNLTVPVQNGRNQKTIFKDVKIDYSQNWQQQHRKTLLSAYNKSPFFEYYQSSVEHLLSKKHIFLFDLNLDIFNWLLKVLKSEPQVSLTDAYHQSYTADVVDFRNKWLPKNFQQNKVTFQYNQVFREQTGFLPNLSIIDVLFNEGPNVLNLLR